MSAFHRPSRDEYFLTIAEAVSLRGDCRRRKVGAVIVYYNRIISTGYNGTLPGVPVCLEGECPGGKKSYSETPAYSDYSDCIAIHAETNAYLFLEEHLPKSYLTSVLPSSTMYISEAPCGGCRELLRAVGIRVALWPGGVELFG
jgi:dCMP deaminase